jgi:hypothetical protein
LKQVLLLVLLPVDLLEQVLLLVDLLGQVPLLVDLLGQVPLPVLLLVDLSPVLVVYLSEQGLVMVGMKMWAILVAKHWRMVCFSGVRYKMC